MMKRISTDEATRIKAERLRAAKEKFLKSSPSQRAVDYLKALPSAIERRWLEIYNGDLKTPRKMIELKCMDCAGFEDLRENVGNCQVRTCSLWHLRPFQSSSSASSGEEEAQ